MPLEVVIEEIQKKGGEQVQQIINEAKAEAEEIIAEAKAEAEEIINKAREDAEKEAERYRRQEISSVNLEMKRLLLNKRKEVLEEVFKLVEDRIKKMDPEEKKRLLSKLIDSCELEEAVVYSNKDDENAVREVISGKKGYRYGGNIDCLGGVILESTDGEVRINLTFDDLLAQVYENKMSEVSKILFGE
ncbi:MAG: V-type ATP synthase subunit E [Archaeoglobus sp.]|nr:MAG: V-type ATP synthase subunit E [Archaeoglobus sp.]